MEEKMGCRLLNLGHMKKTFLIASNIISSLGFTTEENMTAIRNGISGLKKINDPGLLPFDICTSLTDKDLLRQKFSEMDDPGKFTTFEQMLILSATEALSRTLADIHSPRTLFIVSTTKGSIDVLESSSHLGDERLFLWKSAEIAAHFLGNTNPPLVISNACTSGLLAIIKASQLIRAGKYDTVVVTGADLVTSFVASGFQSFMALSDEPCRPFDRNRKGLNLGEAAGTVILTSDETFVHDPNPVLVGHGCSANDATHISAPSRTADGLYRVISGLIDSENSAFRKEDIDFISAHGTATVYNDEMEATALARTGLDTIPVNSFKGYWGHTLGAAGILETIACVSTLKNNILYKSAGYSEPGTTNKVNVIEQNRHEHIKTCMKLASGFGGCNAGLILVNSE
jgi:3-oxoacyl-[acyl-carrier-protein] synthase I